jgi:hypothetical protein
MGYSVRSYSYRFFLPVDKVILCLPAFEKAGFNVDAIVKARKANAMMACVQFDEKGNLTGIDLDGKKGWQLPLFEAIAQYVKDGSYFVVTGENGAIWAWVFKGGEVRELPVTISWDWDKP